MEESSSVLIASVPLQQQEKNSREAAKVMTLPGKSARPLKKRRVVNIEDDDVSSAQQKEQKQPKNCFSLAEKKNSRKTMRPAKKQKKGVISPSPPSSPNTVTKKTVTWNEKDGNMVYVQYPYYDEKDVWYTRENYREFLLDRLHTIESHRYMAADNAIDDDSYCIRGLELFQDETTSKHFQSKKKLYYSIIKMEQMRQGVLGINNPERLRMLVAAQSDLALRRAQELAAQDMQEIYPFLAHPTVKVRNEESNSGSLPSSLDSRSRNESDSALNPFLKEQTPSFGSIPKTGAVSFDSSTIGQPVFANESIRKLQQRSMRRLMGIYQNSDEQGTEGANNTKHLFRFARKDSLLGIGKRSASRSDVKTANKNSVWEVPKCAATSPKVQIMMMMRGTRKEEQQETQPDLATTILQERIKELMQQRQIQEGQLQQEQQNQQQRTTSDNDATSILQERIADLMHQRQILYENHQQQQQQQYVTSSRRTTSSVQEKMMNRQTIHEDHQQQQQQQQQSSNEDNSHSLVEEMIELIQRRQLQHHHHCQETSPTDAISERSFDNGDNNPKRMVEEFLIQQQRRQQEHKEKMQLALMAMNKTRFPIRRDTLSHVHADEAAVSRHCIPWNVTSMA